MARYQSADFGSRLRELRKNRSMTAVELARRVKVTPPAIWRWEHQQRAPRSSRLQSVADALGVSLAVLEGGATSEKPGRAPRLADELSLEELIRAIEAKGFSVEVRSRHVNPALARNVGLTEV